LKKAYLDAAFDELKKKYGTIEKTFSKELDIDAAQQEALRELSLR